MEAKDKINEITKTFGMSGRKAAEVMGVTYNTYRHKKSGTVGHSFNETNLKKLIDYLKSEAESL